ncbi:JmjC domain, hydroxylase-domain-containing protein, partial [Lasiosphaeris hirsuta]
MKHLLQRTWEHGNVHYETDIPACTEEERRAAGLPSKSHVAKIRGNQLEKTAYAIDGIHTPTAYRGTPFAPFQWHVENFWLMSVNVLHSGEKIWYWSEPSSLAAIDAVFQERPLLGKPSHDDYLGHEALFGGTDHLRQQGIAIRCFKQKEGQVMVTYPRVLHSGFSVTDTLAEAINYADETWDTTGYRPCTEKCYRD